MESDDNVSLTFTGSASPYHKGDIAGFSEKQAEAYVKAGVAHYTDEKAKGNTPAAKTADKKS